MKNRSAFAVLGAGSWGTALAIHLARSGHNTILWGKDTASMAQLKRDRSNAVYLPGIPFPENIQIEIDLTQAVQNSSHVLVVVPSHAFSSVITQLKSISSLDSGLIWATKGLAPETHQLLHEVVHEHFPKIPYAVLSGPSFAKEVALDLPTAVTIAGSTLNYAQEQAKFFHGKTFRVYTSTDVSGVEIAGAMKNVLAIAVGIADGLKLGANTRSALITRGLAEIVRLGQALGGKLETFMGLAGMGDLVLTCTDNQSRNRRFGLALGEGKDKDQAVREIGQVVEGIRTAKEIKFLADKYKIEVPITEQIYKVIYENLSAAQAANNLLSRDPKQEGI